MPDVSAKATRRWVMQQIRKTDTQSGTREPQAVHSMGIRFRLHRRDVLATPDIVLPRHRTVIFVRGCFWRQASCSLGKQPKKNEDYWLPKLARNQSRDRETHRALARAGWRTLVVWECETSDTHTLRSHLDTLLRRNSYPATSTRESGR